jgi:hypothetical protein
MTKAIVMIVTTVTSGIGWWLGARFGIMTAFVLSMVGFGFGMWYGKKLGDRYSV